MDDIKIVLEKIEDLIGYSLPEEFKKMYLNGNKIKNVTLMDINDIYNEIVESENEEEDKNGLYTVEPQNSILTKAFDKKRVPFIKDGSGNFVGFDFNPGKEGVLGQIINYGCDEYDMKVFAYNFKDFIDGLNSEEIDESKYLTDYLLKNNIVFLKEKKQDESIKSVIEQYEKKEKIESIIHEEIKDINFNDEYLSKVIFLLSRMNKLIMNDNNVKVFKNYWFDYRIINKNDSLSRTMQDEKCFFEKLDSYNKDEIKGFSFAVTNYIEELKENMLSCGEEKIFVEIDILKNTLLVRYTETVGNENMKKTYEKIIDKII